MYSKARGKQKRLTSYFSSERNQSRASVSRKRPRSATSSLSSSGGSSFRSRNGGSGFGVCPLCQASIAWHVLESHASECMGNDSCDKYGAGPGAGVGSEDAVTSQSPMITTQTPLTCEKAEYPKPRSPQRTKTTSSNIVTPRLAPIFHAKKDERTKHEKLELHQPLQPHSYEPIPGLFVYEDFITEEEESLILRDCVNVGREVVPAWKTCRFNGKHIGKRWGVHCNLRDRRVDAPEHPLPIVLREIIFPKLGRLGLPIPAMKNFVPNEANAIDYRRRDGHWLQAHVDDRKLSKEPIANLSLVGDCYMTFRNVAKHRNLAVPEQRVLLKRRCLQVLTGRARYDFSHGIANTDLLSDRRVSITMRESPLTARALKAIARPT